MRKSIPFEGYLLEKLKNSEYARVYLETALEEYGKDQDSEAFLLALRDVVAAQGGLGKLAEETGLNRAGIYKALSKRGNPRLDTMEKILRNLGFRLSIELVETEERAVV
jgi:probable addiction module antidote protein